MAAACEDIVVQPPGSSELDEAISRGGLVIDEKTHLVYWEGKQLRDASACEPKPWALLVALARKATHSGFVAEKDIYESRMSPSAMATLLGRLKKDLPPSLRKKIEPGPESQSYRLVIESHLVYVSGTAANRSNF